jgi:N-acyl-D-amino-acid deacylase
MHKMNKTLIKGGTVIDGTGGKRFQADIVLLDDKINAIGTFDENLFENVINARGLVVCPGFIDTHSHSDLQVLLDPLLEPKLRQGVTTEILGQDGISMAPLPLQYVSPWRKNLAGLEGDSNNIDWSYQTTIPKNF